MKQYLKKIKVMIFRFFALLSFKRKRKEKQHAKIINDNITIVNRELLSIKMLIDNEIEKQIMQQVADKARIENMLN